MRVDSRVYLVSIVIAASGCSSGTASPTPVAPLTVSISFPNGSNCSPLPDTPCSVQLAAEASAPGDIVSHQWSGCTSGASREAACGIDRPGPVVAAIEVRHRDGRTARRSAQVEGLNRPPAVTVGAISPTPNSTEVTILGLVSDPDEFINSQGNCIAAAAGACRPDPVILHCGAGTYGLEVAVHRTAVAGACTVTITARDSWDLRTTVETTFDVSTLATTPASRAVPGGRPPRRW